MGNFLILGTISFFLSCKHLIATLFDWKVALGIGSNLLDMTNIKAIYFSNVDMAGKLKCVPM